MGNISLLSTGNLLYRANQ